MSTETETKHTATPWIISEGPQCEYLAIVAKSPDGKSVPIAHISNWLPYEQGKANAAWIVNCTDACAGMEDPAKAIADAREWLRAAIPFFYNRANRDNCAAALRALGG